MYYKISFCIVSMNRLYQLKETILKNILDNINYPAIEFILLDYNSSDFMGIWVKENLKDYIESGKVKYYFTPDPKFFNHSLSKNLAFKLASGDILCNINADHFAGHNFAEYVNEQFQKMPNIVLTGINFKNTKSIIPKDLGGKICLRKSDFEFTNGYDERMQVYGYEDQDLIHRLSILGRHIVEIDYNRFNLYLKHSLEERYSSEQYNQRVLINPISPSHTKIIILDINCTFLMGTAINIIHENSINYKNTLRKNKELRFAKLKEMFWLTGKFNATKNEEKIIFTANGFTFSLKLDKRSNIYNNTSEQYHLIVDKGLRRDLLAFRYLNNNYVYMKSNIKYKNITLNTNNQFVFTVYKNFELSPISYEIKAK